jgi:hypothetical protein
MVIRLLRDFPHKTSTWFVAELFVLWTLFYQVIISLAILLSVL